MASIILSTKLCIIQFYAKVLAFVKSDLTSHPQVAIFLEVFSQNISQKNSRLGGRGVGVKKHVSQKILVHFTRNFVLC